MRKASGVLEIPYFQQEDAGIYECTAENAKGRNSVKGKLSFYGRCTIPSCLGPHEYLNWEREIGKREREGGKKEASDSSKSDSLRRERGTNKPHWSVNPQAHNGGWGGKGKKPDVAPHDCVILTGHQPD